MNKLERLLNLTAVLLDTSRPLTADEIRDRVPGYPEAKASFRRAFERDKDDLREMGIPLRVATAPGTHPAQDGYDIPKGEYYLEDPGLEADELAALHLAASAVRLDGVRGHEALWKLGGVTGDPGAPTEAQGSASEPALASLPADANLGPVFSGVVERRTIEFTYREEDRRLDPYRLDFRRGRWYVTGFDHDREEERNFRLDRIDGEVRPCDPPDAFQRPTTGIPGAAVQSWELGEDPPVTARLRVDADQAEWARAILGDHRVVDRADDGTTRFAIEVTSPDAFRSFVLTFLDHAVVEEPPRLRDSMVTWLTALAGPRAPSPAGDQ